MPQSSWERSALVICVNRRVPQCLFLNVKQWENERKHCKGFLCLFRSLSLFMGEFSFHSKYWQIGELTCRNGVNYVNNLSKQTDKQTLGQEQIGITWSLVILIKRNFIQYLIPLIAHMVFEKFSMKSVYIYFIWAPNLCEIPDAREMCSRRCIIHRRVCFCCCSTFIR